MEVQEKLAAALLSSSTSMLNKIALSEDPCKLPATLKG